MASWRFFRSDAAVCSACWLCELLLRQKCQAVFHPPELGFSGRKLARSLSVTAEIRSKSASAALRAGAPPTTGADGAVDCAREDAPAFCPLGDWAARFTKEKPKIATQA